MKKTWVFIFIAVSVGCVIISPFVNCDIDGTGTVVRKTEEHSLEFSSDLHPDDMSRKKEIKAINNKGRKSFDTMMLEVPRRQLSIL